MEDTENRQMNGKKYSGQQDSRPTIGLLTRGISDEFGAPFWYGVADAAREGDANLLTFVGGIVQSPHGFEAQGNVLYKLVDSKNVDGLVIWTGMLGHYVGPEEMQKFCQRYHTLPQVSVELPMKGIPSILGDFRQGMRNAITHLIEVHDHRRIAFIRGPEGSLTGDERYHAYIETLEEHGISIDPSLVAPGTFFSPSGAEAIRLLLDERKVDFEAIVAANDTMALDALRALQARGLRVPGDLAVVGFDDIEEARSITPPLTTVHLPFYEWGRRGAEILLARLQGQEVPDLEHVPLNLVVRQSCGCMAPAVLQAVARPIRGKAINARENEDPAASPTERSRGDSLEETITACREEIISEMTKAVNDYPGDIACRWSSQLLDAFTADLKSEYPVTFLPTFEEILRHAVARGSSINTWQGVLSVLRRKVLPYLSGGDLPSRAEDLWNQVRVMAAEVAERAQSYRGLQIEQQATRLREIGQAMITTSHLAELMHVLAQELPHLGVHTSFISLYDKPQSSIQWSRLALAYNEKGRVESRLSEQRFPACELVPPGSLPRERGYNLVIEPLYFREEQLGVALFEPSPQQVRVCDALRGLLSSALKGVLLVQQAERRALQLQTAAQVSRATGSILEPDKLIQEVVELACKRFDLYYVGLFLVDQTGEWTGESGRWAVLRAGSGEAGEQMLARGHKLEIGGESMIGWCIANRQARIALDVGEEAVRFENPFLPATRSEMALPLISRGGVMGAMTVQSDEELAFSNEDIAVLQTMADQLAVAIENAYLFNEQQQMASLLSTRIRELDCLNEVGRKLDERPAIPDLLQWVTERIPSSTRYPDLCVVAIDFEGHTYGAPEAITLPCQMVEGLRVTDEVVGRMYVAYRERCNFQDGDSALLGGIARRISGYLENQRLFEQTQAALAEVEATHRSYLRDKWEDYVGQRQMSHFLYEDIWASRLSPVVPAGPEKNANGEQPTHLDVPIVLRGQTIGVLGVEDPNGVRQWSAEDQAVIQGVSHQLAMALENARLLEEAQRRAARERLTGEIAARMRETLDMNTILQTTVRDMGRSLGLHDVTIRLETDLDEESLL